MSCMFCIQQFTVLSFTTTHSAPTLSHCQMIAVFINTAVLRRSTEQGNHNHKLDHDLHKCAGSTGRSHQNLSRKVGICRFSHVSTFVTVCCALTFLRPARSLGLSTRPPVLDLAKLLQTSNTNSQAIQRALVLCQNFEG